MARFEIVEGSPGQGKSLYTADKATLLLDRNKRWIKQGGEKRVIWSNIKFSDQFEKECYYGTENSLLNYWSDTSVLCNLRDVDILWDEIATELDGRNWVDLSREVKRFLSQYRKRGIDIYANTQDFSMIDARARLMINRVFSLRKLFGSQDISTTKPKPKVIWGFILIREVQNFREVDPEKKKYALIPSWMFIQKKLIDIYDTRQDIALGKLPPLIHREKKCDTCHRSIIKHE